MVAELYSTRGRGALHLQSLAATQTESPRTVEVLLVVTKTNPSPKSSGWYCRPFLTMPSRAFPFCHLYPMIPSAPSLTGLQTPYVTLTLSLIESGVAQGLLKIALN